MKSPLQHYLHGFALAWPGWQRRFAIRLEPTPTRNGDCLCRHIFQIVSGNKIPFGFILP
jgi:hypothetical protein